MGNINADSKPMGTIINTQVYLVKARISSGLSTLRNFEGASLNLGGANGLLTSGTLSMSVNGFNKDWVLPPNLILSDFIIQINK